MTDFDEHPISSGDEAFDRDLNRHRATEQRDARDESALRLRDRGVVVNDDDSTESVVEALEAVEAFERAVEACGGDLMVDAAPAYQPDDPRFVLPRRRGGERLGDYAGRVRSAAGRLRADD